MDKFDCIKLFILTAKLGSFTATANELNLTQSAISKKIAWLEHKIGFTLFHRSSRKIELTEQGKEYLHYCEPLLDSMDDTEFRLKGERHTVSGELKISVPSAMATQLLAQPISDFMLLHPNLSVNVSVNDRQVNLIEGHIDVAIRTSTLKDSNLKARLLFENEAVYFASPAYLKNKTTPKLAQDLEYHNCLTYTLINPSNVWYLTDKNSVTSKILVHESFKSDSPELLLNMAILGRGITALPKWMIEDKLKNGSLIQVFGNYKAMCLPTYALYKSDEYQPFRVRVFIDFLVKYFSN